MADFTTAQIGQTTSAGQGTRPVERPSGIAAGLSLLAAVAPSSQELQARREAEREAQKASVVDQFRQESLRIADAVDRGEMTSAQGRMRQRAVLSRFTSDNPIIAADISKVHEGIVKTVGMGKVLVEGNEEEQQQRALVENAINRGWATPEMNDEQTQDAVNRLRLFDLAQEKIKAEQAAQTLMNSRLSGQSTRLSIGNAQIERERKLIGLEMDRSRLEAMNNAYDMASQFSQTNVDQLNQVLAQADGASPELRAQLVAQVNQMEADTITTIQRGLGRGATSEQIANAMRPMQIRLDSAREVLNGTIDRNAYDNQVAITQAQEKYNLLLDPRLRSAVGITSLFGERVVLEGEISAEALAAWTRATGGSVNNNDVVPDQANTDGVRSSKEYLDTLRAATRAANSQQLTEGSVRELETNIDSILGVVADSYRKPAQSFTGVAQAMASPEVGEYIRQHGSILTTDNAAGAKEVFRNQYADVVLPLIQDEWQTTYRDFVVSGAEMERRGLVPSNLRAQEDKPVQGNVRVDFTGGGIVFRASQDLGSLGRAKLNRLNQQVAPAINTLIRLGAHLDGNTDYRKFYEDNYAAIFDTAGSQPVE